MSEKRPPKTWLVLVPEGDEVQFARSPMADGNLVVSDMDSVRAMFTKATHQAFFGIPIYKAEIGPIKLLDESPYSAEAKSTTSEVERAADDHGS